MRRRFVKRIGLGSQRIAQSINHISLGHENGVSELACAFWGLSRAFPSKCFQKLTFKISTLDSTCRVRYGEMDFFDSMWPFSNFTCTWPCDFIFFAWWASMWLKWVMGLIWSEKNGYTLSSQDFANSMKHENSPKIAYLPLFENGVNIWSLEAYEYFLERYLNALQCCSFEFFHLDPLKSSKLSLKNMPFWEWPIISSSCMNFKRSYLLTH